MTARIARIDRTVVSGVLSLDGQDVDVDVDNNVWLVGDDDEVLVVDAPHDAAPILEAVGGRRLTALVLTHGHNDHLTAAVELPLIDVFGRGGATKSSWYGDCLPSRDFPMLVDLYLQGRFPLDKFVTERIGVDGVEQAFERMHHGDVLRSVVTF